MKVYSVRNDLWAINEDLEIVKLEDLPNPYFFVDEFEYDGEGVETDLKAYPTGVKVYKLEFNKSSEIYYARKRYEKTYEADVRYVLRLFIDGVLEIADYREDIIAFFDIETDRTGRLISIYVEKIDRSGEFFYGDEKEILKGFMDWLMENDVVVLLAWNGYKFDFPIVGKALERYEMKKYMRYWSLIEKLDYMLMYKKYIGTDRMSLDYVAKENGLEGKVEYEGEVWNLSRDELYEYNKRDVDIMVELELKYRIMKLVWEIAKLVNIPISEVVDREYNGRIIGSAKTIIDVAILRHAREKGYVLPTSNFEGNEESFEGAYIFAKKGMYDWVYVYDVNSMYPSIMLHKVEMPDILKEILEKWFERRFYYKRKWKEGDEIAYFVQLAYKILINAFYGVNGYKGFRLYNKSIAEAITREGRNTLMSMKNFIERKLGYEVVYADTDSVYVYVGVNDEHLGKIIEKKLNEYIYPLTLDWEKVYRRLIIFKKKRYAGITTEGKLDVKGLEMVRGDVFDLEREMQKEIIEYILENGWNSDWLSEYLNNMYRRLYSGEFDDKLIFTKGVKESWDEYKANTPQLRAWKKLGDKNVLFVDYYWSKSGDVEPLREGEKPKDVDYRYYWSLIVDMVDRIKEVFVKQRSLFDFGGENR